MTRRIVAAVQVRPGLGRSHYSSFSKRPSSTGPWLGFSRRAQPNGMATRACVAMPVGLTKKHDQAIPGCWERLHCTIRQRLARLVLPPVIRTKIDVGPEGSAASCSFGGTAGLTELPCGYFGCLVKSDPSVRVWWPTPLCILEHTIINCATKFVL